MDPKFGDYQAKKTSQHDENNGGSCVRNIIFYCYVCFASQIVLK